MLVDLRHMTLDLSDLGKLHFKGSHTLVIICHSVTVLLPFRINALQTFPCQMLSIRFYITETITSLSGMIVGG